MKKQYAILRNNKQIGLFTLKEIALIELFSSDLIWVQGKSITWRTPEQIDELKQYVKPAPVQTLPIEAIQVVQPKPVNEIEVTPKTEVKEAIVNKDSDIDRSPETTHVIQEKPVVNETEIAAENKVIEATPNKDNETNSSPETTPVTEAEPVVNEMEVAPKVEVTEATATQVYETNSSSETTPVMETEPVVKEVEVAPKIEVIEAVANKDNDENSSTAPIEVGQLKPVVSEVEVTEAAVTQVYETNSSPETTPVAEIEPVVDEMEIARKVEVTEAIINEDNDTRRSSIATEILEQKLVSNKTEVASEIEVIKATDKETSPETTEIVQPKLLVNETEVAPKIEAIEATAHKDENAYSSPTTSVVQPNFVVNEIEAASESQANDAVVKPIFDKSKSPVAPYVVQPKPVVSLTEVAQQTEVEATDKLNNDTKKSLVAVYVVPPKSAFHVNEATVEESKNTSNSPAAPYVVQPEPVVKPMEVAPKTEVVEVTDNLNNDTGKFSVAAYVVPPKSVFDANEAVVKQHNETGNSPIAAYVVQPKPVVHKDPVTPESKIEAPFDQNNDTKMPSPERQVYIRFPLGIPQLAFDRQEESIEDRLEKKAPEVSSTKIFAAKPTPETENDQPEVKYNRSLEDIKAEYSSWLKQQKGYIKGHAANKPLLTTVLVVIVSSLTFILWRTINAKTIPVKQVTEQQAKKFEKPAYENPGSDDEEQMKANIPAYSVSNTTVEMDAGSAKEADKKTVVTLAKQETKDQTSVVENSKEKVPTALKKDEEIKIIPAAKPVNQDPKVEIAAIPAPTPQPTATVESAEDIPVPLTNLVDVKGNVVSNKKQGISALDLTVNNRSNTLLTLVAVDVFYYKKDKTLLNKQIVFFSNVKPGSKITLDAPENKQAAFAEWKLGLISSSGNGITYAKQ